RLAAVYLLEPHARERIEGDPLAVRRFGGPAQNPRRHRTVVEALGEADRRGERLLDGRVEWNLGRSAALQRDARELAAIPDDDRRAVGQKRVVRVEIERGEVFLIVAREAGRDHALRAGRQIADDEHGLGVAAAEED